MLNAPAGAVISAYAQFLIQPSNHVKRSPELSRQSCEIRDLLQSMSGLALSRVNDFKG